MARYLLDTNIFLRSADENSKKQAVAREAVRNLITAGDECYISSQILSEFWVVATRPLKENGLGWSVDQAEAEIKRLIRSFPVVVESSESIVKWVELTIAHQVRGKRAHDIKLLALMLANGIGNLVTFNPKDFPAVEGITIVNPTDLIE